MDGADESCSMGLADGLAIRDAEQYQSVCLLL